MYIATFNCQKGILGLEGKGEASRVRATNCHCGKMNLAPKISIWRQLLAKEKSLVKFLSGVGMSPPVKSHCLVPLNGHQCIYLKCQLTPQLSTTQYVADLVWTRAASLW